MLRKFGLNGFHADHDGDMKAMERWWYSEEMRERKDEQKRGTWRREGRHKQQINRTTKKARLEETKRGEKR